MRMLLGFVAVVGAAGLACGANGEKNHSISGVLAGYVPVPPATISLMGAATASTTPDSNGNFSFPGLSDGNYTLIPSQTGYVFSPSSIGITLSGGNATGRNFTATGAYSISGTVSGPSVAGVVISLPMFGKSKSSTTDASGHYVINGLANYTYSLTASGTNQTFSPASITLTVSGANVIGQNFAAVSTLGAARASHTATVLPSGKVLSTGGWGGNTYLASAELYDAASSSWTPTGALATARSGHTATLLPSGKVLVVGGNGYWAGSEIALSSAELYDPALGTWTATGSLSTARAGHTATLLSSGKVLVAGGLGPGQPAFASTELYDPALGTWTATGSLSTARTGHTATLLSSGKVLVVGGNAGSPNYAVLGSAELYDPAAGGWTGTGPLATPRESHTATLLGSGTVVVVGGTAGGVAGSAVFASAELYDPGAGTWSATGSLTTQREGHTATLLASGKVFVVAGFNWQTMLSSAELYDPATGSWKDTGTPLVTARTGHSATLLPSGAVLVAAGEATLSGPILATAEPLDPGAGN